MNTLHRQQLKMSMQQLPDYHQRYGPKRPVKNNPKIQILSQENTSSKGAKNSGASQKKIQVNKAPYKGSALIETTTSERNSKATTSNRKDKMNIESSEEEDGNFMDEEDENKVVNQIQRYLTQSKPSLANVKATGPANNLVVYLQGSTTGGQYNTPLASNNQSIIEEIVVEDF